MKLPLLQKYLKVKGIDLAFLIHPDSNITYFTQMEPSFAFLLIYPQKAEFYLSLLDLPPKLSKIVIKRVKKGWENKLKDGKVKKVAINKETLTLAYLEKLKKIYPKASFEDISFLLKELRSKKTEEEVKKISRACQITDKAFQSTLYQLERQALKTEKEVASFIEKRFRELGAEPAFPTIAAMGSNGAIPHHLTSPQKLRKGFLLLDFGARYKNYCADMSRVVYLGKPGAEEQSNYELLLNVQEQTIAQIKEKIPFSHLTDFAKEQLGRYSSYFIHSLGHGLGIEVHEAPSFSERKNKVQDGHVFTIEPGLYFPQKYGLRIEDTLLYYGKTKVLTKSPKELIAIRPFS